jgi:AraC-like DNA-binding protein
MKTELPDLTALQRLPMPLSYFRIMLRELGGTPARRAELLRGTHVTDRQLADPAAEITLGQQLTLQDNAARLCPPGWALDVGRRFDLGAQGPLGFAMVSAATLEQAFDVMARYGHVRAPWFRLGVERDARRWGVVIARQFPLDPRASIELLETLLLSAQALVESVLGRSMREARITVDYAAPAWAERYAAELHCPVKFGAARPTLRMPAAWLSLPCPSADAALYQLALGRLEGERRRLESGDHLEARIEVLLAAAGDAGLSLVEMAQRLNLSRRTLLRRLRAAGTSFSELLQRHRMRHAEALLATPQYSIGEVAYRLGYSDPANFSRAFRRWFGTTPGRQRADARRIRPRHAPTRRLSSAPTACRRRS